MLILDKDKCTGCKLCEKNCPFGAILVVDRLAQINPQCNLCGACVNTCPGHALSIERKRPSPEELSQYSGIFVLGECAKVDGRVVPKKVVYELVSKARMLSNALKEPVSVIVLGDNRTTGFEDLISYGAERILYCRHALLGSYTTEGFTNVIAALITREKPSVFLFGATPAGRDLAPRIAARLHLGLTADCTGLDVDEAGQLVQTRPAFGGNIMASIVSPYTRPQMATVRPNVFRVASPDILRKGTVEEVPVSLSEKAIRVKVVEKIRVEKHGGCNLEEAQIIVSAGRGCGSRENLKLVEDLAKAVGGTVAGSRAIVELGWIPYTLQVGQSGTTVSPELYIALGISGAIQHVAGMSGSRTTIAVNSDPEAPIFKIADLGIIGDALKIVPKLISTIQTSADECLG